MKITGYACLESLMYEATVNLSKALEKHKKVLKAYLDGKASPICLNSAKKELSSAAQRIYELSIANKIINEMEEKGVEL